MNDLNINSRLKLNNGEKMPILGFGTYQIGHGKKVIENIHHALKIGYRLIDTASYYGNEEEIGEAIRLSDIPREDIFITTKVRNSDQGFKKTLKAFEKSFKKLDINYIDLYLIHWPVSGLRRDTWKALEKIYDEDRCRAIGVSNYMEFHLKELFEYNEVIPVVNQVEFSPYLYQKELLEFCRSHNIQIEAYSPLTKGVKLNDPRLVEIAKQYSKTSAQILIRWGLQHGVIEIPKSSKRERIQENSEVFDFTISESDMTTLNSFDEDFRYWGDPRTFL